MRSLARVAAKPTRRRIAALVVVGLLGLVVLGFVPWRQTVSGSGRVGVLSAMDRPQQVEAQISGRIVRWVVREGQDVREGDPIAVLADIDPKFLDVRQPERLREQRDFARVTQQESEGRVARLQGQWRSLSVARDEALSAARQAVAQAQGRRDALRAALRAAVQSRRIAQEVAVASARERTAQADDRAVQAEQALAAAEGNLETARLRRARVAGLLAQGLRSRQDDELAQNDLLRSETEAGRARKALEIARRDGRVGALTEGGAALEVGRAAAAVAQAEANLEVGEREILASRLNLARLTAETAAGMSRVDADVQSARESAAKNSGELRKVEIELGNLRARGDQRIVRAPRSGRVARILAGGSGAAVKAGDVLVTMAPTTVDRMVELTLTANDAPLVRQGSRVRLQFAGWPAVQLGGAPALAVGTFGGRVAFVDPVDDGKSGFRAVVVPDRSPLPTGRKDPPWPDPSRLRPGALAFGWVLLDEVTLGFEVWRQLNGFPPQAPTGKVKAPGPIRLKAK